MKYNKLIKGIIILSLAILTACGGDSKEETKVLRPVLYQEVGYDAGNNQRTFNGTAQTDKVINLSFRNNGIITKFDINLGQRVKKGQLLASLDNVASRLSYEQSVASLSSAESQMKTTKLNYDRVRSLYEKGSAALSDFENAKNSFQNAKSSFESSQRSVAIQKEQINYGFIYAPEDGIIADVSAEIDENVSPGQTVAVLNAGNKMTINLGLPENVINSVKQDMKTSITFPALTGSVFEGRITEISPAINSNTATYPIKIEITNATKSIKSGMAANITFDFSNGGGQLLVVPAKSVGEDSKGRFVFLVDDKGDKTGIVKKHHIEVGKLKPDGFEVTSGLSIGQKIAVAGLQTLLDGQEVKLQQ